jgi:hypothetical protein
MAGGYWRTFISAALTTGVVSGASWLAFGTEAWLAFVASLPRASEFILTEGNADWAKLQSVFGLVRIAGGGASAAWTSQVAFIAAAALAVTMMWRSQAKFELKAAVLAIGALLATPYVYIYDLVVLAVPIAFLIREGLLTAPLRGEVAAAAAATLLIVIFPFVKMPVGFAAVLIVAALIARRVLAQQLQAGASPSPKSAPA